MLFRSAISTCVLSSLSANAALPSDVKPSDPAANAVQRVLGMHLMKDHGGKFAGNSSVSRAEVAKALKGMAEAIVSKHWVKAKSAPLTVKRVDSLAASKGWKTQVVSRYSLAISIIKMGDYLVNGIHRAAPDATDTGQSTSKIMRKPALPKGRASDASLKYLVKNRMM